MPKKKTYAYKAQAYRCVMLAKYLVQLMEDGLLEDRKGFSGRELMHVIDHDLDFIDQDVLPKKKK